MLIAMLITVTLFQVNVADVPLPLADGQAVLQYDVIDGHHRLAAVKRCMKEGLVPDNMQLLCNVYNKSPMPVDLAHAIQYCCNADNFMA